MRYTIFDPNNGAVLRCADRKFDCGHLKLLENYRLSDKYKIDNDKKVKPTCFRIFRNGWKCLNSKSEFFNLVIWNSAFFLVENFNAFHTFIFLKQNFPNFLLNFPFCSLKVAKISAKISADLFREFSDFCAVYFFCFTKFWISNSHIFEKRSFTTFV